MNTSDEHLLREAKKVVLALGKMFAPFCEVVLHDLRTPEHAIVAIENNLSGRRIGDATTNLGLERLRRTNFPDVIQNYPNTFPDGRPAKSTSIGIRNPDGVCIGSICLNLDISGFSAMHAQLTAFVATSASQLSVSERLVVSTTSEIQDAITAYAARKSLLPGQLPTKDKRRLVLSLNEQGLFKLRNAVSVAAQCLQVSRPTIYNYLKDL